MKSSIRSFVFLSTSLLSLSCFADTCSYLRNDQVVFQNMYASLVNRGPNMLVVYGTVTNNDNVQHVLSGVKTENAKISAFQIYRQDGGAGAITAHDENSLTLNPGSSYVWQKGGNHIMLGGFNKKTAEEKLQFGTSFDPNQTIDITFTFSDGCQKTVEKVPIRDRMND